MVLSVKVRVSVYLSSRQIGAVLVDACGRFVLLRKENGFVSGSEQEATFSVECLGVLVVFVYQ